MNNPILNTTQTDKSFQHFKMAIGLSIIPILFGIAFIVEPFLAFALIMYAPIWGICLLLSLIFSTAGIVEGMKLIKEKRASPKTKTSLYGNSIILIAGLFIIIFFIAILFNGLV